MAGKVVPFEDRVTPSRFWQAIAQCDGNVMQTAKLLQCNPATVRKFRDLWSAEQETGPELPDLPEGDYSAEELIEIACERFKRKDAREKAKRWRTIKMPTDEPFALAWLGDPHIDNDGCNWPLLMRDLELFKSPGVYVCNIGDSTDNWVGRLTRLHAQSSMTQENAYKLVEWLVVESGVHWLVWLLGNHDAWNDGSVITKLLVNKPKKIVL